MRAQRKSFIAYDTIGEFESLGLYFDDYYTFLEYIEGEPEIIQAVLRPENLRESFDSLCFLVYERGNLTLIVDEIEYYGKGQESVPGLIRIAEHGRHRDLNLIGMTRRPALVSKTITAQVDKLILFRVQDPNDVRYFSQYIHKDILKYIRKLDRYEYLLYEFGEISHYDKDSKLIAKFDFFDES